MRISTPPLLLLSALVWTAMAGPLAHQLPAQNQYGKQGQRETLKASGNIKALGANGLIQMVTEDGEEWLLKVGGKAGNASYFAEADTAWLKPGMLVRFSGQFDDKGQAQSAIQSMAVVSPRPDLQPGIDVNAAATAGKDLFSRQTPDPTIPQKALVTADVVGKLTTLKGGAFSVAAPPGTVIRGELAEKAVISVELGTLQLAKVGDSIEVNAWYPAGTKGQAIANRVTIRAKQPLKGYVKPPRTLPAKSKSAKPAEDPLNGPT